MRYTSGDAWYTPRMVGDTGDPLVELLGLLREQADDEAVDRADVGYVVAARKTVELWRQWWGPRKPIAVPDPLRTKFHVIYPLALHALNNVVVGLDLSPKIPWVAAVNARIAFEHALTAQWVLLTHNGEQELHSTLKKEAYKRAKAFHQGLGSPAEYAAMVGPKPPDSDWSVWNMCARFADAPELFYDIYRNLSGAVHPSYGTVTAHLNVAMPSGEVTGLNPRGAAWPCDETPRALGVSALWALEALEELRLEQPHVAEIVSVGATAQLPACLRYSDQHPERQDGT